MGQVQEVQGLVELDQDLVEVVLEFRGLVELGPVVVELEVQVLVEVELELAEVELVGDPGQGPVEMKLQGQAEMKYLQDQEELTH